MHIILLKFGHNRAAAPDHIAAHKTWIEAGISEGIFQCVGSLDIGGGFIMAHGENDTAIRRRVDADPFVEHGVVSAEIHKIDVNRTVAQLDYLKTVE